MSDVRHVNLHDARESRDMGVPRPSTPAITDEFGIVWPDVARLLTAMLRRRGVNPHDADEIVQETAARALSVQIPFADADDLLRWSSVVSWRLAIDIHRRRGRLSEFEVPDRIDPVDVAAAAEHRVVLDAVQQRFPELSPRDQQALLSSFTETPARTRLESVRLAVARHRARTRLRALLNGLAAPILVLWARRNRLWSAPAESIAYAAAPAAACLLMGAVALTGTTAPHVGEARGAAPIAATSSAVPVAQPPAPDLGRSATTPIATKTRSEDPEPAEPRHAVPPGGVSLGTPNGNRATADVRPQAEDDELACVTPPPVASSPGTVCIQQPGSLGLSPP